MSTAVIYARVSSTSDRQNTDRQIADLTRYATTNNLEVVATYTEHISGAKKNADRPELCKCIDFCVANGISTLLLSELSRLGRSVFEVIENIKILNEHHICTYFQKEGFSTFNIDGTPNPFTAIFVAVLGTCAQLERENILYRLESGKRKYLENGGKLGPKVGTKYKSTEDKKQEYAKVLRELRKGTSIRKTAKLCDVSISTVQRLKSEFGL